MATAGPGTAATEGPRSRSFQAWFDAISKLGAPLAVIIAAVAGALIAQSFQQRISATTVLSARENAESQLRASMFSGLIDPIVGREKEKEISPYREALLIELLALNFHEHFEVKPLLERVDKRLQELEDAQPRSRENVLAKEARDDLRSIVRRIVDRQVAVLEKNHADASRNSAVVSLYLAESPDQEHAPSIRLWNLNELITGPELRSPDSTRTIGIRVTEADWRNRKFVLTVYECVRGDCTRLEQINDRITPSWADLPFTDNTLLSDGNRFAIVVYDVYQGRGTSSQTAFLKLIWFPKGYFTPRERPLDQRQFLELVGKQPR